MGAAIRQFRLRCSSSATGVPVTFLSSRADREQTAATEHRSLSHERKARTFVCVGDRDREFPVTRKPRAARSTQKVEKKLDNVTEN